MRTCLCEHVSACVCVRACMSMYACFRVCPHVRGQDLEEGGGARGSILICWHLGEGKCWLLFHEHQGWGRRKDQILLPRGCLKTQSHSLPTRDQL